MNPEKEINLPFSSLAYPAIVTDYYGNLIEINSFCYTFLGFSDEMDLLSNWRNFISKNSNFEHMFNEFRAIYTNEFHSDLVINDKKNSVFIRINDFESDQKQFTLIQIQDVSQQTSLQNTLFSVQGKLHRINSGIQSLNMESINQYNYTTIRTPEKVVDTGLSPKDKIFNALTDSEKEICELILSFHSQNEIAEILHKDIVAIRSAMYRITRKTGFKSTKELVESLHTQKD